MFEKKDIYKTCKKCGTKWNASLADKCPVCLASPKKRKIYTRHKDPFEDVKCLNCGAVNRFLKCQHRKFCSRSCASEYNGKKSKI
jgi:hypothetical protein